MAASVHVVARYLAKPGKEDEVRAWLVALIARRAANSAAISTTYFEPGQPARLLLRGALGGRPGGGSAQCVRTCEDRDGAVEGLVEVPPDVRRYGIL